MADVRSFLQTARQLGCIDDVGMRRAMEIVATLRRSRSSNDIASELLKAGLCTVIEVRKIQAALDGNVEATVRGRCRTPNGARRKPTSESISQADTPPPARRQRRMPQAPSRPLPDLGSLDGRARLSAFDCAPSVGRRLEAEPAVILGESRPANDNHAVPKYSPISMLGRGGMGEVQLVRDRDLHREVAIKTLIDADDRQQVRKFVEEARVTGQLEHPNIVPIYELGTAGDQPFLVMKRVQGRTLADVLKQVRSGNTTGLGRDTLPTGDDDGSTNEPAEAPEKALDRLLDVFLKVCDAVAYAHWRGVIHRDLKPANIMVGEFGEVLVMDWGLARLTGRERTDSSPRISIGRRRTGDPMSRTLDGDVMGTPMYMPPEQARGQASKITPRSDIYSLGAVLYEILTLARPFRGRCVDDVLGKVKRGQFTALSEASRSNWSIPRELEAAVLKAMSLDPADRYASVADFKSDLEAYRAGRTLKAADYSLWQLLAKWTRRNRVAVIGGAAAFAALIIGLVVAVIWSQAEQHQRAIATAEAYYARARALLPDARTREFNEASPSDWYEAWLPICLRISQGIQAHPDAPAEWKEELATYCATIQHNAETSADWGMATHIAESACAWNAVDDDEGVSRVQQVAAAKSATEQADVDRLLVVLNAIAAAEDRFDDVGDLVPGRDLWNGEVAERARRLASSVRSRPAALTAGVLYAFQGDASVLARFGVETGSLFRPESRFRRHFLVELVGRLGDPYTTVPGTGSNAAHLVAEMLAQEHRPGMETDMSLWVLTAARLEAARPGSVSSVVDLDAMFNRWRPHVGLAVRTAETLLGFARGNRHLSPTRPGGVDSEDYRAQVSEIADWLASAVESGSAWTATVQAACTARTLSDIEPSQSPTPVRSRQREFLIHQLGLFGDTRPVAPGATSPGEQLLAELRDTPGPALLEAAPLDGRRLVVALINSLSRLGAPDPREIATEVEKVRLASRLVDLRSLIDTETKLATALLPLPFDENETPADSNSWWRRGSARFDIDPEGAIADFTEALRLDPTNTMALNDRAIARSNRGDLEGAIRDLDRVIELGPRNESNVYSDRGALRSRNGDLKGALDDFRRSLELAPWRARTYVQRALTYTELGYFDAAILDCNRAIELAPEFWGGYFRRARALVAKGDVAQAIEDLDRAIERAPNQVHGYVERGRVHSQAGEFEKAILDFDRAILLNPGYAPALANRGWARMNTGDFESALADCNRAIQLAGEQPEPEYLESRAWVRRNLDDRAGAIKDATRAIEIDPTMVRAWIARGTFRSDLGDFERALADKTHAIELDQTNAEAFHSRGLTYRQMELWHQALPDFVRAVELDPENAVMRYDLGRTRWHGGDSKGAIEDLDRALELDPTMGRAYGDRGGAYAALGNMRAAMADYDRAVDLADSDEDRSVSFNNRGLARVRIGDLRGALQDANQAVRFAPDNTDFIIRRGMCRERIGDVDGAFADHDRVVQLAPGSPWGYYNRGHIHQIRLEFAEALADFDRVIELDPRFWQAWVNRGAVFAQTNRRSEALAAYREGYRLCDNRVMRRRLASMIETAGGTVPD